MKIENIKDPSFLKSLDYNQLNDLSQDIRQFIIESVSKTGGHLSSNLGIVELTIALHYVFDSPKDKIFFDVGHQSYVHKILTGRAHLFPTLRQYNGLSGFQKRFESEHDPWEAGHSSTALSAGIAMAVARDLNHEDFHVIPVVGDGALASGESFEALNHLGSINNKVILILNDNHMSISKSIGGINDALKRIRASTAYHKMKTDYKKILQKGKFGNGIYKITKEMKDFLKRGIIEKTIFDDFGLEYLGPVDGHNLHDLIDILELAKSYDKSVVVHVHTKKGKGYSFAENDKTGKWHGVAPFDVASGEAKSLPTQKKSWSQILSNHVYDWMKEDEDIVAVTPAMINGSCLNQIFQTYPQRSFDVGIAEEHALTFTAGLAQGHKKPFVSVYSSFLQRAYDQINHDISRMKLPCLCAIDRAGIVGEDGPTHHGVFDVSMLASIPHLVLFAPKDAKELKMFVNTAFKDFNVPYFLRIPRGSLTDEVVDLQSTLEIGTWTYVINQDDYDMTVITYGDCVDALKDAIEAEGLKIRLVNARFIKPIDEKAVREIFSLDNKPVLVYETIMKTGSLGALLLTYCNKMHMLRPFTHIAIEDHFSIQGSVQQIYKEERIDLNTVLNKCKEILNGKEEN